MLSQSFNYKANHHRKIFSYYPQIVFALCIFVGFSIHSQAFATVVIDKFYPPEYLEKLKQLSDIEIYQEINNLRDDHVKWNAYGEPLIDIMRLDLFEVEKLATFLNSDDYQQRQYIAHILRRSKPNFHSDRLFEVLVEGLQEDRIPYGIRNASFGDGEFLFLNAYMAFDDLLYNGSHAKKYLLKGLKSKCRQQKFLCAILLGENKIFEQVDYTIEILCENLKDDDRMGNACHAFAALHSFGPKISEKLVQHHTSGDAQSKKAIEILWREFGMNPKGIKLENAEIGTTFGHTPKWSGNSLKYLINYNKNEHYRMWGSLDYYKR